MTSARGKPPSDSEPPLERLLTVRDVAAATGFDEKTVRKGWIKRGELQAIRIGRGIRIRLEGFQEFLKRREMKSINSKLRRQPK